jgi:hypothetical protein
MGQPIFVTTFSHAASTLHLLTTMVMHHLTLHALCCKWKRGQGAGSAAAALAALNRNIASPSILRNWVYMLQTSGKLARIV